MTNWTGTLPIQCDICYKKMTNHFVEGRLNADQFKKVRNHATDPYGIFCLQCAQKYDIDIGTGKGKLFTRINGKWICIAGNGTELIDF